MSARPQIDPRGSRFAATLTTLVLAAALLTEPPTSTLLLAVQAVLFAIGAVAGIGRTPYAWLFKTFLRPRLGAPTELEDAAPPRFAQTVGLGFALVGLVGYLAGADTVGLVATGFALAAAFLNAAFGFCLGCELFLLVRRVADRGAITAPTSTTAITTDSGRAGRIPAVTKG